MYGLRVELSFVNNKSKNTSKYTDLDLDLDLESSLFNVKIASVPQSGGHFVVN